mgnify:CR=1 FL=1
MFDDIIHAMVSALLGSARDSAERAQRALRLIADASYCNAGVLYLIAPTGPWLAARVGNVVASPHVDMKVRRLLTQSSVCGVSTPETPWSADGSTCFTPMLLRHHTGFDVHVAGVAVMANRLGASLDPPAHLLRALSRSLCAASEAQRAESQTD